MPIGLEMEFTMNPKAMTAFASLNEAQRAEIVEKARSVSSKEEMHSIVNSLAKD